MTRALGETSEQAWARHLAEQADDEDADVVISTFYEPSAAGDFERARVLNEGKAMNLRMIARKGASFV